MTLRYPIVLVHGLGGFDRLQLSLGGHAVIKIHYFHAIARHLRDAGVPAVHAAALPPHAGIARRAAALAAFIGREVEAPHFHLIAHSMGGLDSRHYLSHLGGAARGALSLTTLATPHRGSPLATLAVESLFNPCLRLARRLHLGRMLTVALTQTAAHRDLRPAACAAFNAATPDAAGVAYFSWAGDPSEEHVQWPLRPAWGMLRRRARDENNDGMVPLSSARWSGWRGCVPADHLSLAGWQLSRQARRAFSPADFYVSLLPDLKQAEE